MLVSGFDLILTCLEFVGGNSITELVTLNCIMINLD